MKMTTLCYIEKDGQYLMLHRTKKEKDINKDKWIGVGGHAEGHLDLNRSLQGAMKTSSELEMLSVKVRILESDMKLVKSKVLA